MLPSKNSKIHCKNVYFLLMAVPGCEFHVTSSVPFVFVMCKTLFPTEICSIFEKVAPAPGPCPYGEHDSEDRPTTLCIKSATFRTHDALNFEWLGSSFSSFSLLAAFGFSFFASCPLFGRFVLWQNLPQKCVFPVYELLGPVFLADHKNQLMHHTCNYVIF